MFNTEKIRLTMYKRKVSQKKLGEFLDIHQTAVSKKLLGEVPFNLEEIINLSNFLEVSFISLCAPKLQQLILEGIFKNLNEVQKAKKKLLVADYKEHNKNK